MTYGEWHKMMGGEIKQEKLERLEQLQEEILATLKRIEKQGTKNEKESQDREIPLEWISRTMNPE